MYRTIIAGILFIWMTTPLLGQMSDAEKTDQSQKHYHMYSRGSLSFIYPHTAIVTAPFAKREDPQPLIYYIQQMVNSAEKVLRTTEKDHTIKAKYKKEDEYKKIIGQFIGRPVTVTFVVEDVIERHKPEWIKYPDQNEFDAEIVSWLSNPYVVISTINWQSNMILSDNDRALISMAKSRFENKSRQKIVIGNPKEEYERDMKSIMDHAKNRIPSHTFFIETFDKSVLNWKPGQQKTTTGWLRRVGLFNMARGDNLYITSECIIEQDAYLQGTPASNEQGKLAITSQPATQPATTQAEPQEKKMMIIK